ncbi:hypothetical protein F0562_014586 [Nyssa sinensis]|uniref:Uncharacterized protein n=1 Tax=Nyssa sinensis TaxID=561372 RepID=A0A5J4ZPA3_9ASTE|nr:hypothetical protein F0562_014586 [Nyssa sinensis]
MRFESCHILSFDQSLSAWYFSFTKLLEALLSIGLGKGIGKGKTGRTNEGSLRTSSGGLQSETGTTNSAMLAVPTVVLSGSRPFSGQHPTILQSRDRADDCGSSYEENFEGSKDSGDTNSVGDPELVSTFEGQSGGFGSAQRHGSRGSKSRQIMERRERDARREGKWERKHS